MTKIVGSGYISQRHGSAVPVLDPDPNQNVMDPQHCPQQCLLKQCCQGVTKSCHPSLLTNSALPIRVLMGGMGVAESQPMCYSCAHHETWSPNKLLRSASMSVADSWIRMFLGLPDPDPLVRDPALDPIVKQNSSKNLDYTNCFVTSLRRFIFEK